MMFIFVRKGQAAAPSVKGTHNYEILVGDPHPLCMGLSLWLNERPSGQRYLLKLRLFTIAVGDQRYFARTAEPCAPGSAPQQL